MATPIVGGTTSREVRGAPHRRGIRGRQGTSSHWTDHRSLRVQARSSAREALNMQSGPEFPVVVIGAGPAGVSVAVSLRDRGMRPLLVDRADRVAASWRGRYDRLRLNTARRLSHLPRRPYPKGTGAFPSRDQVVDHLDTHAHEDGIELRLNTTVDRIDRR